MNVRHAMKRFLVLAGASAAVGAMIAALVADQTPNDWPMFGQNAANSASTSSVDITTKNVGKLQPKWVATTGGDVSARGAVVNGVVYVPDWGGNLWALTASSGQTVWHNQLSDYGLTGSFTGVYHSRTTPAVDGGVLYVGVQEGAWLLAIQASTGALF